MSYNIAKKLKIDKENNKISCELASSNLRDYRDRLIFEKIEDLYSNLKVIEDKIATLYYDIVCGNIHVDGKLKDLVCSFDYIGNGNFYEEFKQVYYNKDRQDYDLYKVYKKYEEDIKNYIKKDCILRKKNTSGLYIIRVNKTSVSMNYVDKDKARKFSSLQVKNNDWYMENFDIIYI